MGRCPSYISSLCCVWSWDLKDSYKDDNWLIATFLKDILNIQKEYFILNYVNLFGTETEKIFVGIFAKLLRVKTRRSPFWSSWWRSLSNDFSFFDAIILQILSWEGWLFSRFSVTSDWRFFLSVRTFKKTLTQSDKNRVRELHWFQVAAGWRSILIWNRVFIFVFSRAT